MISKIKNISAMTNKIKNKQRKGKNIFIMFNQSQSLQGKTL